MKVEILPAAKRDLVAGYWFYEQQRRGLCDYFLQHLQSDIDSLERYAGIHHRAYRHYHWLGSRRFPHAVLYHVVGEIAYVDAVIDCRRSPDWIHRRLKQ